MIFIVTDMKKEAYEYELVVEDDSSVSIYDALEDGQWYSGAGVTIKREALESLISTLQECLDYIKAEEQDNNNQVEV